jgi:hypothetical protein
MFTEQDVTFYLAEILLALDHLHSLGISCPDVCLFVSFQNQTSLLFEFIPSFPSFYPLLLPLDQVALK